MAGHSKKRTLDDIRAERRQAEADAYEAYQPAILPFVKRSADDRRRFSTLEERALAIDEILDRLVAGQSLTRICNLAHLPAAMTFVEWMGADHSISTRYVRAREIAAELFAMDIVAISDDELSDPNSRRVRVEARKWVASKLLPKIYGDKIEVIQKPDTIPNAHVVDLVELSDSSASEMLLLEHGSGIGIAPTIVDVAPQVSETADLDRESADKKDGPR